MGQNTSTRPGTEELIEAVERAAAETESLRAELAQLRTELAAGLTTRRLAVVDETGFERVVVDTLPASGSVSVHSRDGHRADLHAGEETSTGHAGVYVGDEDDASRFMLEVDGPYGHRQLRLAGVASPGLAGALAECVRTKRLEVVDAETERVVAEVEGPHLWLRHPARDAGIAHLGCYPDEAVLTLTSNEMIGVHQEVAEVLLHAGGMLHDNDTVGASLTLALGGHERRVDEGSDAVPGS